MAVKFTPERWQHIQSVLDELIDVAPEQQQSVARELCADDSQLFDEVMQLLGYRDRPMTFLEAPAMSVLTKGSVNERRLEIEGYTLLERIGVGGMGVVYRAERDQGDFTQEVAIKFLSEWQDKETLRQRFRQEQQLLADLEHPSIAKLYGGGMSKDGLPYLIMEYVRGEPIDRYCDQQKLGLVERLRLIKQVAKALEHAHGRLIVHRDIKPSNILVNPDGDIKLLDFGIAKLIGDFDPNLTRTEDQIMTPGFAAPEQILNQPIAVATDVYQLGLVAYLLVTGRQAHFEYANSVGELINAICEQTPEKPSTVVAQLKHDLGDSISSVAWSKTLKGDLDAIVLTMLRSQTRDRYGSMVAVVADIDAYFEYRPISSLSQSSSYQIKKWLRRYRVPVGAITLFVAMIGAYAVTAVMQAKRIEVALDQSILERQKAQSVTDLMVDMFKAADPNTSGIETITAQQLLDQGQRKIIEDLSLSPAIQAKMLTTIGEIYYSQGQIDKSLNALEVARVKHALVESDNDLDFAKTLTNLAAIYNETARHEEAAVMYEQSLALILANRSSAESAERYAVDLATTQNGYGVHLLDRGDLLSAETRIRNSLELLEDANLKNHEEYANALSNLATIRITQGQLLEASGHMKDVIEIQERTTGETHPFFSLYLVSLANVLTKLEQFDGAKQYIDRAISLQLQILGDNHPDLANSKRNLGVLLHLQGDLVGAESELRGSLIIREANFPEPSIMTGISYRQLANVLIDQQKYVEAEYLLNQMSSHYSSVSAGGSLIGLGLYSYGLLSYRQGDFIGANKYYEQAIAMLSGNELRLALAYLGKAASLLQTKDSEMALGYAKQGFDIRTQKLPVGHSLIAEAEAILGFTLIETDQVELGKQHLANSLMLLELPTNEKRGTYSGLVERARRQLDSLPSR